MECLGCAAFSSNLLSIAFSSFLSQSLQTRLNEILKENKEFRSSLSLMETKVDQVMDENGALSSQVRMPGCSCTNGPGGVELTRLLALTDEVGVLTAVRL